MPILGETKGKNVPVKVWSPIHEVESAALDQLKNVASLPWVFHHVAAMADVHVGKGATVGSVIALKGAVMPAAVGVDIGCGMQAVRTSLKASQLPDNLEQLRASIEASIPLGPTEHAKTYPEVKADADLFSEFKDLRAPVQDLQGKALRQCGTLGGGNHFIEVCLESNICSCINYFGEAKNVCPYCKGTGHTDPHVWIVLHSGSRNIGKVLAEHHMAIAQRLAHNAGLPDKDLAAFLVGTSEMAAYRNDLYWAQRYAAVNRKVMMSIVKDIFAEEFGNIAFMQTIACHHNYVAEETHFGEEVFVTRKGAINADKGRYGIIPGSMGTKTYIVKGLGNEDSFRSASHGAGRRMSRGQAKRTFTQDDLNTQTAGVCCRKDLGILDEIPAAYKNIDQVMENQTDLVQIVTELKQVLCVKG